MKKVLILVFLISNILFAKSTKMNINDLEYYIKEFATHKSYNFTKNIKTPFKLNIKCFKELNENICVIDEYLVLNKNLDYFIENALFENIVFTFTDFNIEKKHMLKISKKMDDDKDYINEYNKLMLIKIFQNLKSIKIKRIIGKLPFNIYSKTIAENLFINNIEKKVVAEKINANAIYEYLINKTKRDINKTQGSKILNSLQKKEIIKQEVIKIKKIVELKNIYTEQDIFDKLKIRWVDKNNFYFIDKKGKIYKYENNISLLSYNFKYKDYAEVLLNSIINLIKKDVENINAY